MTDFKNLFEQALLAEAAYANFAGFANLKDALIAINFSDNQATSFVSEWTARVGRTRLQCAA